MKSASVVMYFSWMALVRGKPLLSPYSSSMSVSTASNFFAAHCCSIIASMMNTVVGDWMLR